jgi:hypothetical protein
MIGRSAGNRRNWDVPPCGVQHVTEIFGAVGRSFEIQHGFKIVCLVDLAPVEVGIVHGEIDRSIIPSS